MSEEFDKEAERERLREKYESESSDREITERMSQLLLQGATMTNTHCDTCGSPIFRYQGQEFCPVCQAEGAEGETPAAESGQAAGTGGQAAADQGATEGAQTAQGATQSASTVSQAAPEGSQQAQAVDQSPAATQSASGAETASADAQSSADSASVGAASTGTAELGAGTRATRQPPTDVRESLSRTIATLSERAREAEDPRQAKALLEAAHEAARTMATLSE